MMILDVCSQVCCSVVGMRGKHSGRSQGCKSVWDDSLYNRDFDVVQFPWERRDYLRISTAVWNSPQFIGKFDFLDVLLAGCQFTQLGMHGEVIYVPVGLVFIFCGVKGTFLKYVLQYFIKVISDCSTILFEVEVEILQNSYVREYVVEGKKVQ